MEIRGDINVVSGSFSVGATVEGSGFYKAGVSAWEKITN